MCSAGVTIIFLSIIHIHGLCRGVDWVELVVAGQQAVFIAGQAQPIAVLHGLWQGHSVAGVC